MSLKLNPPVPYRLLKQHTCVHINWALDVRALFYRKLHFICAWPNTCTCFNCNNQVRAYSPYLSPRLNTSFLILRKHDCILHVAGINYTNKICTTQVYSCYQIHVYPYKKSTNNLHVFTATIEFVQSHRISALVLILHFYFLEYMNVPCMLQE